MTPLIWLALAIGAAAAAYVVGSPALREYRAREARDHNAERYRAWRGGGRPRQPGGAGGGGLPREELGRMGLAAGLGAVAIAGLIIFFVAS